MLSVGTEIGAHMKSLGTSAGRKCPEKFFIPKPKWYEKSEERPEMFPKTLSLVQLSESYSLALFQKFSQPISNTKNTNKTSSLARICRHLHKEKQG